MSNALYLKTDRFEHRTVRDDFAGPSSFGEDFARWLIAQLEPLRSAGFTIGTPSMEDYGHGFLVTHGNDRFWVALSYAEEGPVEEPAHWVVSLDRLEGFNPLKRLFSKPDEGPFTRLRDAVWNAVRSDSAITEFTEAEWQALGEDRNEKSG
ncbi:MAG: hypothetical protein MUE68_04085 [Bacteroidetes bacterium]|jgi:hypothetical protein|nr:hypothetical protein [Bacteroidota bacterium]